MFSQRAQARERHEASGTQWLRPYTACFWCLNPQSVCHRANPATTGESNLCEEKDVVLPLCYGIFDSAQGGEWLYDQFGRRFYNLTEFFDWLGEESTFGGGRAIQAVRVAAAVLAEFELS